MIADSGAGTSKTDRSRPEAVIMVDESRSSAAATPAPPIRWAARRGPEQAGQVLREAWAALGTRKTG
jgi:hypothetical protein